MGKGTKFGLTFFFFIASDVFDFNLMFSFSLPQASGIKFVLIVL